MRASLLIAALLVAACSAPDATPPQMEALAPAATPSWENARAEGVDFRAVGQEPGWLLDIYIQDHIVLEWDYGEQRAVFALPEATSPVEGETRYDVEASGHVLSIIIRSSPCQDVMSGEDFPARVDITIDGRELMGCGRSL
jgi:uncharacterized membrane protein